MHVKHNIIHNKTIYKFLNYVQDLYEIPITVFENCISVTQNNFHINRNRLKFVVNKLKEVKFVFEK